MPNRPSIAVIASLSLLILSPVAGRAADVLQHVPNEALGFVFVKNLAAADGKVERLLKSIESDFPAPLAFLQAATGVSEGLDPQGDLLFVVLPGAEADHVQPQFAVWLTVRDYDRFVATLGGAPGQKITGVTVAGEDVLVAHHGRWVLVMDPNERARMDRIVSIEPTPPPIVLASADWIRANDIAAVALPKGVQAVLAWAAASAPAVQRDREANDRDQPLGFGQIEDLNDPFAVAPTAAGSSHGVAANVRAAIRKWAAASPRLAQVFLRAQSVGCGARLDEKGNLNVGLRVQSDKRLWNRDDSPQPPLPALYQGGGFVLYGAGELTPAITAIAAGAYARALVHDLTNEEHMVFRNAAVTQFVRAAERAGTDVRSAVVLTQPGDKQESVYTNDFLLVRAASARAFADNAKETMRLWNSMSRDAQAEMRLVFDVEEVKFGGRTATQYSLDVAAADGAAELPEVREAMERFFGPGGKLRLWIVPVDDQFVLLATATPEQLAAALETLDRKQTVDWNHSDMAAVSRLLPADAEWQLFFSPHRYNAWHRRVMDAITGPAIGGPIEKDFPASPPIGFAGGIRNGELWFDTTVPTETLKATAAFLQK